MERPSRQRGDEGIDDFSQKSDSENQSTSGEWVAWNPCPECGSKTLRQIEISSVYATEDGSYGGADVDDYSRIECGECDEVLQRGPSELADRLSK